MPAYKVTISSQRALQIWPHLVEQASQKQTIYYGELAEKVGIPKAPLALIASLNKLCAFCRRRGMPQLPVLVVSKMTKLPGGDTRSALYPLGEKERAWEIDWNHVAGPSLADLA